LAYHNAQLEASAFREQYDSESFNDLTEPKVDMIHKVSFLKYMIGQTPSADTSLSSQRAGKLMKDWKIALVNDDSANTVIVTGSKRKAVSSLGSLVDPGNRNLILQDITVDEAEIRSKHDDDLLGKVLLLFYCYYYCRTETNSLSFFSFA